MSRVGGYLVPGVAFDALTTEYTLDIFPTYEWDCSPNTVLTKEDVLRGIALLEEGKFPPRYPRFSDYRSVTTMTTSRDSLADLSNDQLKVLADMVIEDVFSDRLDRELRGLVSRDTESTLTMKTRQGIREGATRSTWSYYQCWQALEGLGRGTVIQDKLAASTVAMLGYWHERGNTGAIAGV